MRPPKREEQDVAAHCVRCWEFFDMIWNLRGHGYDMRELLFMSVFSEEAGQPARGM